MGSRRRRAPAGSGALSAAPPAGRARRLRPPPPAGRRARCRDRTARRRARVSGPASARRYPRGTPSSLHRRGRGRWRGWSCRSRRPPSAPWRWPPPRLRRVPAGPRERRRTPWGGERTPGAGWAGAAGAPVRGPAAPRETGAPSRRRGRRGSEVSPPVRSSCAGSCASRSGCGASGRAIPGYRRPGCPGSDPGGRSGLPARPSHPPRRRRGSSAGGCEPAPRPGCRPAGARAVQTPPRPARACPRRWSCVSALAVSVGVGSAGGTGALPGRPAT